MRDRRGENVKTAEETRFSRFQDFLGNTGSAAWIHPCNERMKNERQRSSGGRIEARKIVSQAWRRNQNESLILIF